MGEGPGKDEDRTLRAFTGPSGKVLWAMARDYYAGIERSVVYVTNLSKYRLTDDRGKDRAPTPEELLAWAPDLLLEVLDVQPELVVTLGRFSTTALLGRLISMEVANGSVFTVTIRHRTFLEARQEVIGVLGVDRRPLCGWIREIRVDAPDQRESASSRNGDPRAAIGGWACFKSPLPEPVMRTLRPEARRADHAGREQSAFQAADKEMPTGAPVPRLESNCESEGVEALPQVRLCQERTKLPPKTRDLTVHVAGVTHPAAGLHQPQMLAATAFGLQRVGRWLDNPSVEPVVDEWPMPAYRPSSTGPPGTAPYGFEALKGEVAIDTEGYVSDPWSLQFSVEPGVAWIIRADDMVTLWDFADALKRDRPTIIFHHALHDLAVLKAMGIDVLAMGLPFRDTMIELFLRQTDPQGLKASAERLCGMAMRSYEDVVGPVAEQFARDYLQRAAAEPPGEWCIGEGRKHSILKRIDGLLYPRPTRGEAKTIREKWEDEDSFGAVRAAVEAHVGPMPAPRMDDIPQEEFIAYACRDSDATLRQARVLGPSMDALGLRAVHRVDHDALPLVARMQEVGMLVDTERWAELREYVRDEKQAALEVVRMIVGDPDFNPASGDQVAAYCVRRGLKLERLTKGGKRIQVNEDQLMLVRFDDDAIEPILTYKELDKLEGTYIDPLPKFLHGEGRYRRLHATFRTTAAITGRLAVGGDSSIPLMGIPVRSDVGRKMRGIFVAPEGMVLGSADLSQIELRVGAGLSQDEHMMEVYANDGDIHASTASGIFGVPEDALDPMLQRYPAKTMNFLILFGGREHRLYAEMLKAAVQGFDLDRCRELIEKWFALYPGVEAYLAALMAFGAERGYVLTDAGRRRYVPALRFTSDEYPFGRLREEAMRQASNFPIQGTAQEIIKRAMPRMQYIDHMEPLVQVHDEIIVETPERHADAVGEQMVAAMTAESPWRGVKLKASWKTAPDWAGLK